MTNIEQKALELVNEVRGDDFKALCRAIERHEAFRQEVSDAVVETKGGYGKFWEGSTPHRTMSRFIIAKPDPLVEALKNEPFNTAEIQIIRDALDRSGLEIREKGE